jgi:hypothetical protein
LGKILMSKFLLNLLVQISKALVYSKIQFLFEKEFSSTFSPIGLVASRPIRPFGPEQLGRPSRPTRPCPPSPSSLPHRAGSAAASSRSAAAPSSVPWSCNGWPPINSPPSSIGRTSPPLHSGNDSHESVNYRRRPPFPAARPPSRPYKRVPALWWSTSPLHLASFPPQSCLRHARMKTSSEQITLNYFQALPESHGRDSFKGGRFVTPTFCK